MATCAAAHICWAFYLSPEEATLLSCYYPTYGENHFSFYFHCAFRFVLILFAPAFICLYSSCYCVNGKWVFAEE